MPARTRILLLATFAAIPGCHQFSDVTSNPRYGGAQIVGKCYRLGGGEWLLEQREYDPYLTLYLPGDHNMSVERFRSGKWDRVSGGQEAARVKHIVAPGTLIRIVNIIEDTWIEDRETEPLAVILDGPFKGMNVFVGYEQIHHPYGVDYRTSEISWNVDSGVLEECDERRTEPGSTPSE